MKAKAKRYLLMFVVGLVVACVITTIHLGAGDILGLAFIVAAGLTFYGGLFAGVGDDRVSLTGCVLTIYLLFALIGMVGELTSEIYKRMPSLLIGAVSFVAVMAAMLLGCIPALILAAIANDHAKKSLYSHVKDNGPAK